MNSVTMIIATCRNVDMVKVDDFSGVNGLANITTHFGEFCHRNVVNVVNIVA